VRYHLRKSSRVGAGPGSQENGILNFVWGVTQLVKTILKHTKYKVKPLLFTGTVELYRIHCGKLRKGDFDSAALTPPAICAFCPRPPCAQFRKRNCSQLASQLAAWSQSKRHTTPPLAIALLPQTVPQREDLLIIHHRTRTLHTYHPDITTSLLRPLSSPATRRYSTAARG